MTVHRVSLSAQEAEKEFRRMADTYLRHDPQRGVNVWADAPFPVMLVWSPRIYEFLEVLEGVLSYPPARGLCREVGYRSGLDGAVETRRVLGVEAEQEAAVLLAMPPVLAGAGWGVSHLTYDDETEEVTWVFPRGTAVGIAARRRGTRQNPACALYEGLGAGWVQGSLGLHVEFLETGCRGMGDPVCRFVSRPLATDASLGTGSAEDLTPRRSPPAPGED